MILKFVMRDTDGAVVSGTPTVTADGSALTPTGSSALWQVDAALGTLVSATLTGAVPLDVMMPTQDPTLLAETGDAMTLTAAYDKAKDDVLTPLAVVDGLVDKLFDGTGQVKVMSIVADNSAGIGAALSLKSANAAGLYAEGLYGIQANGGPGKDFAGDIYGSLSGSVASVTGAVGSVTSAVTTANAADVTAILEDTATTIPASIAAIDGKIDTVDTVADAILEDTSTTLPATLATIDGIMDDILEDTGTTLPATLTAIEGKVDTADTVVDAILEDTATTIPAQIAATDAKVDTVDGILDAILPLIQRVYRYFFNKRTHTNSSVVVYADDGVTPDATMAVSGDTTTVTKAAPE